MPRHEDELELEVDDPLLVELQAEDYWYEAYNMRTGARGVFPAYYAIEVTKEPEQMAGSVLSPPWCHRAPPPPWPQFGPLGRALAEVTSGPFHSEEQGPAELGCLRTVAPSAGSATPHFTLAFQP